MITSPMDGSPQSGLLQRNHPMALRCRRVGAVHSIKSRPGRAIGSCPLRPQHQTSLDDPDMSALRQKRKCNPEVMSAQEPARERSKMMYNQSSAKEGISQGLIMKARVIIAAAATLLLSAVAHAAEIKVLASAAIRDAYLELLPQFEKATGNKVTAEWSGTPTSRSASRRAKPPTSSFWVTAGLRS